MTDLLRVTLTRDDRLQPIIRSGLVAAFDLQACDQARTYGSVRSQLIHVSVQKSTRTTCPRSSAGPSGAELSHSVAPPSEGMCRHPNTVIYRNDRNAARISSVKS